MFKKKKRDNPFFYLAIKNSFLCFVLVAVIYAMYYLNTYGLGETALGKLLSPPNAQSTKAASKEERWSVCKEGLYAISYHEELGKKSWKILKNQEGWQFKSAEKTVPLSQAEFEKCQEKICNVHVFSTQMDDYIEFDDSLTYSFTNSSQTILRLNHEKDLLFHEGKIYRAKALVRFLKKLPKTSCQ